MVDGFEDWYRAVHPRLVTSMAAVFGDPDLARDAADEAIVRAYERWDRVGAMANPAGWVYRVAINVGRRRHRRRSLETRLLRRERIPLVPGPTEDLHLLIADLPPRQQLAVVLRNIEIGFVLDLEAGGWRTVSAPEDDFLVPAAATSVVAGDRFVLVGGQPALFRDQSQALVVLALDPDSLMWAEPEFPLPEPDSAEGNIGSQVLVPSADGRLVFDGGLLGGDTALIEIDPNTGVATAISDPDPSSVLAVRADGTFLRRPQG